MSDNGERTPEELAERDLRRAERRARGEAFVDCACGNKHWGLLGAAGILAWRTADFAGDGGGIEAPDQVRRSEPDVLMQLRVSWSHRGGTWAVPGGAINRGETAWEGAVREFTEESGFDALKEPTGSHVLQHPDWVYTTFVAQVDDPNVELVPNDESEDLRWVPISEVASLDLMEPFRAALPTLRALIDAQVD